MPFLSHSTLLLLLSTLSSALPLPSSPPPFCTSPADLPNCIIRGWGYPEYDTAKNGCDEVQVALGTCIKATLQDGLETMIRVNEQGESEIVYQGCTGIEGMVPKGCVVSPANT